MSIEHNIANISADQEKNRQKNIITTTRSQNTEQSKSPIIPPMQAPEIKKQQNGVPPVNVIRKNNEEQESWNGLFYFMDGRKYRLVPSGNGQKPVFAVKDDDKAFADHEKDEVELDFPVDMLEDLTLESIAEMWKGKIAGREDGYVPDIEEILYLRQSYLSENLPGDVYEAYNKSLVNGADSGATLRLLKNSGVWEMYRLLDLTRAYHVYGQFKDEYRKKKQANHAPRAKVTGSSQLPLKQHGYEKQTGLNCYGCAGSKIINNLMQADVLDQYKVRGFEPRYLSPSEYQKLGADYDYDESRRDIEAFAGSTKSRYGNFFAVSDVIFDKKKYNGLGIRDIALHKTNYYLGAADTPNALNNVIQAMKEKLHSILGTGQPACFFSKGHYVTIVGLTDDNISYLDSLPSKPKTAITKNIDAFLRDIGDSRELSTVEITYATKLTPESLETLKNEYDGIGINEQTGEVIQTNSMHEFEKNRIPDAHGKIPVCERSGTGSVG